MSPRVRNFASGVLLILLCLLLVSCVDIQFKVELRSDGSGTAEWVIEIPKSTVESLGMNAEKVKAQFLREQQFQKPGVRISTGRAAGGGETVTVTAPFASVQELGSGDMACEFQKTPNGRQCTFRMNARGGAVVPVRIRAEVRMPGRITGSNAESVSGNVARFDNVLRTGGLWVQSETSSGLSGIMMAMLALAVVAVVAVSLLVIRMKKKAPRAAPVAAAATIACRQCGAANKPEAKFCRSCGGTLAAPAPAPAAAPVSAPRCPNCGAEAGPGRKFCHICGQTLAPSFTAAPPVAAAPPTPAAPWALAAPPPVTPVVAPPAPPPAPPTPAAPWPPVAAQPSPAPVAAPQPAKNAAMMVALVASLVLLLAAIALLAYKLYFQNRAAAPSATPAQPATISQPAPQTPAPAPETPVPGPTPELPASAVAPAAAGPQTSLPTPGTQPQQPSRSPAPVSQAGRPTPMPQTSTPQVPPPAGAPPSQAASEPPQPAAPRAEILKPQPAAPPAPVKPAYSGPSSGVLIWSGQLQRDGLVEITGSSASSGTLRGELPGAPVIVEVEPKDVGVAEAPSPANGWKRLVLRSRTRRLSVVTIKWAVIQ